MVKRSAHFSCQRGKLGVRDKDIDQVVKILKQTIKKFEDPAVTQISKKSRNPFLVLISCILSLRTKDRTTLEASERLFNLDDTPQKMKSLSVKAIETAIYPVGFYRVKAGNIKGICRVLCERYNSKVPDNIDELLKLKTE